MLQEQQLRAVTEKMDLQEVQLGEAKRAAAQRRAEIEEVDALCEAEKAQIEVRAGALHTGPAPLWDLCQLVPMASPSVFAVPGAMCGLQ
jgi:hypothetical protein